ncbi:hypothetical protein ACFLQL_04580, partial [Verrucomicrobiota bacterium]
TPGPRLKKENPESLTGSGQVSHGHDLARLFHENSSRDVVIERMINTCDGKNTKAKNTLCKFGNVGGKRLLFSLEKQAPSTPSSSLSTVCGMLIQLRG